LRRSTVLSLPLQLVLPVVALFSGLYYKHMIVNDYSRVVRMTFQVVASPTVVILATLEALTIVILMTLEVSFLLENINSTGITYNLFL
jgi:hypothetical protein